MSIIKYVVLSAFISSISNAAIIDQNLLDLLAKTQYSIGYHGYFINTYHGSNIIINYEALNQLSIAYYYQGDTTFNLCFMRTDTLGNILCDLRDFRIVNAWMDVDLDWAAVYCPGFDCVYDDNGNSYMVYSNFDSGYGYRVAWVKVDKYGKIIEDRFAENSDAHFLIACPSDKYGYHTLAGWYYFNPKLKKAAYIAKQFKKKIWLMRRNCCIELDNNEIMSIGLNPDEHIIELQYYSPKGKLKKIDSLSQKEITKKMWFNVDLPNCYELFKNDSLIYYFEVMIDTARLMVFTKNGGPLKYDVPEKASLMSIEEMPVDCRRFLKILGNKVYYFGLDSELNLYHYSCDITERVRF